MFSNLTVSASIVRIIYVISRLRAEGDSYKGSVKSWEHQMPYVNINIGMPIFYVKIGIRDAYI